MCSKYSEKETRPIITAVTSPVQHAEGPHWDCKSQTLYYVDTFKATVYNWNPFTTRLRKFNLKGRDSVGVIVPIKNRRNHFLVSADRHFYNLHWPYEYEGCSQIEELNIIEPTKPKNQFNDGKVDKMGRLWIGTLERNKNLTVENNGGSLYMFDHSLSNPEIKITPTSISNGIAWSKDDRKFYFIDSQTRNLIQYDFDILAADLDNPKVIFTLNSSDYDGIMDGMTIDVNDNLWIALFGGHGVINVNSKSGEVLRYIKLPAKYCTSATFGGPNFDILYVTTSKLHLTNEELEEQTDAGSVFAVTNLGVHGLPSNDFIFN